jgi:TonB-dependent outer membrane receptor, SusC/RagA subfamily, signature region
MRCPRFLVAAQACGWIWAAAAGAQAPTGTITGRVVDSASRLPIVNVNVVLEGTGRGAITRGDGAFVLAAVPVGSYRIRAARIGYLARALPVTVTAAATSTVPFSLSAAATTINEVVVTGYGTQRREAVTGSVSTVNADDANVGRITTPTQLMQGRIPGVNIVQNNGGPGAGAQVRIRGGTSISASNDPLYVIDGVPINNAPIEPTSLGQNNSLPRDPLSLINPNDIETITVLKDASATAIYGSRGANGVVQITTRRGSTVRPELTYDTYVGMATRSRTLDVLNGDEYRTFVQGEVTAGRLAATRLASLGTSNTNWEEALLRTGATQSHNLAFSGGAATTRYRGSLGLFDQQGIVLSSGIKRMSARLSASQQAINNRLRLGINLNTSQVKNDYLVSENTGGFTGTAFTNMLIMNPTQPCG